MRAGGDNPGWNQRLLLARRLVEAGVRVVTVDLRWWNTHDDNCWSLKNGFLPPFDQCYSALIDDLDVTGHFKTLSAPGDNHDQRGLLETTLVVAWGEHGRTPRINKTAGRDHWMSAFSAAIAGGGVKGGRVVGGDRFPSGDGQREPQTPSRCVGHHVSPFGRQHLHGLAGSRGPVHSGIALRSAD